MTLQLLAAALMGLAGAQNGLTSDPVVHEAMVLMVSRTRHGFSHLEVAAFIVRDADGNTTVIEWPATGLPDSARWVGPVPRGAIAIAHTHPSWEPRPSRIDVATARHAQMPVYVVTPMQVWKTAAGVTFRIQ